MAVNNGDVLEATARAEFNGVEDVVNVYQIKYTGASPKTDDAAMLEVADFLDTTYQIASSAQSTNLIYREISFRNLTQGLIMGSKPWPTLTAGSGGGASNATGVAGLISLATGIAKVVLRKYLGGYIATVMEADGTFTSAFLAGLLAFGARLLDMATITGGNYEYGYLSPKTGSWEVPTSVSATDVPAYQRRRKQGSGS